MRSDPRPMMSTRRRLLGAAALAGLATPWRLRAAPADLPRLLVVFLRGACDMGGGGGGGADGASPSSEERSS